MHRKDGLTRIMIFMVMLTLVIPSSWVYAQNRGVMRGATLAQEWVAVQETIGASVEAHQLLAPLMNATGLTALSDAAQLRLSASKFGSAQNHPAQMMDAVQRLVRSSGVDRSIHLAYIFEDVNSNSNLIDLSSLSAQDAATLLVRLAQQPDASSLLWTFDPVLLARGAPAYIVCDPKCQLGVETQDFSSSDIVGAMIEFNHPVQGSLVLRLVTKMHPCRYNLAPCGAYWPIQHRTTEMAIQMGTGRSFLPISFTQPGACSTTRTYHIVVNSVVLGQFSFHVSSPPDDPNEVHHRCLRNT